MIWGYLFIMTNTTTTEKLTAETITDKQIRSLGIEAFEHGDQEMFDLTAKAIDGDAKAREACADAINNARAMEGT